MNTSLALALLLLAADPQPPRLDVGASWAHDSGSIESKDSEGRLHGLQTRFATGKRLTEYSVFNHGQLEQRFQFYPSGETFRFQYRHSNGDGDDVIYGPERTVDVAETVIVASGENIGPIKQQPVLAQGKVKGDKRWEGVFLVQVIDGFEQKLVLQHYTEGKLVKSTPTDIEPPCSLPAWPE